jgi:hypothetical protein
MTWDYFSRLLAEEAWAEYEKELSPAELAEMQRRQDEEREADYFEAAWAEMRAKGRTKAYPISLHR